ncbi:pre-mRNA-processing protein 40C-like isoform X2 [Tasmannia lanceolata]|uniref:pre-mRNA-processing protein 40C-like isoform X2 n=1 Tax=Tasmannia lanceolata TaxID=3420 RepID=UPI00406491C1
MSSSAWLPQEVQPSAPGVTPQVPISGPAMSPPTPVTASPAPVTGPPTPRGPNGTTSEPLQESVRAKFVSTPGYVVPAPSFSYSVVPKINAASGNSQQSPSAPGLKLNPPVPAAALQPPVPGQSSSTGPSFSYNIASQSNVGPASGQQPQPSANTSAAGKQEANNATPTSSISQSVPLPVHIISGSSISPAAPNLHPPTMWMQIPSSFPRPPGMPGTPRTPGPPGIPSSASLSSTITVQPTAVAQNAPPHMYSPYPSLPSMAPPPQAPWLHPLQVGSLSGPPFLPYPGVLPGPYPLPIRGMPLSSGPLSKSQPPGVSPIGPPGGASPATLGSGQPASSLGAQSPPPGIDQDKQANDPTGKDEGIAKKDDMDTWTAHKTDTGAVYYYNAFTGESTYEKPPSFKGETDKVTVQPTPVSWEKLAGTEWSLVTTNDGKKYYYNAKNKVSSWQVPLEVSEMRKKQDSDSLKTNTPPVQNASISAEKGSVAVTLSAPAVNTGGRDATPLRSSGALVSSSALDLIKKKLQDAGTPVTPSPLPGSSAPATSDLNGPRSTEVAVKGQQSENSKDKLKDANGDGNMSDSSSDSDDVDSGPTKEECIIQFKEMLKERGVAPFSKWDKELPKILFDPRFKVC